MIGGAISGVLFEELLEFGGVLLEELLEFGSVLFEELLEELLEVLFSPRQPAAKTASNKRQVPRINIDFFILKPPHT